MEENKRFLPIGTVVMLNGGSKRLMVAGYLARTEERTFDYFGLLYPEGMIDPDKPLLFDHSQISQIYNKAFVDEECISFMNKVSSIDAQIKGSVASSVVTSPNDATVINPVQTVAEVNQNPVQNNTEVIPELQIETLGEDISTVQSVGTQTVINPAPTVEVSAPVQMATPVQNTIPVNQVVAPTPVTDNSGLAPVQMPVPVSAPLETSQTTII